VCVEHTCLLTLTAALVWCTCVCFVCPVCVCVTCGWCVCVLCVVGVRVRMVCVFIAYDGCVCVCLMCLCVTCDWYVCVTCVWFVYVFGVQLRGRTSTPNSLRTRLAIKSPFTQSLFKSLSEDCKHPQIYARARAICAECARTLSVRTHAHTYIRTNTNTHRQTDAHTHTQRARAHARAHTHSLPSLLSTIYNISGAVFGNTRNGVFIQNFHRGGLACLVAAASCVCIGSFVILAVLFYRLFCQGYLDSFVN